ncbi:hypothetical protein BGZ68_005733 [Mortierella alpina]|nr:hypothetical protein BGZ68_005733 [Mortierella alpina]
MPLSVRRSSRQRSNNHDDLSSSMSAEPIVLKGGHSFNFISQWFFLWVIPLLRRSRADPDFDPDSIELQTEESAQHTGERLGECWRQEVLDHKEK